MKALAGVGIRWRRPSSTTLPENHGSSSRLPQMTPCPSKPLNRAASRAPSRSRFQLPRQATELLRHGPQRPFHATPPRKWRRGRGRRAIADRQPCQRIEPADGHQHDEFLPHRDQNIWAQHALESRSLATIPQMFTALADLAVRFAKGHSLVGAGLADHSRSDESTRSRVSRQDGRRGRRR